MDDHVVGCPVRGRPRPGQHHSGEREVQVAGQQRRRQVAALAGEPQLVPDDVVGEGRFAREYQAFQTESVTALVRDIADGRALSAFRSSRVPFALAFHEGSQRLAVGTWGGSALEDRRLGRAERRGTALGYAGHFLCADRDEIVHSGPQQIRPVAEAIQNG